MRQPVSLFNKQTYKFCYPSHEKLAMPALSPTMEKGSIQVWNVKEGDSVSAGDVICEVETDKSTVGFEVQEDMVIAKILIEEGNEVDVGTVVAIAVDSEEDVASFKDYKLEEGESSAPAQSTESQPQQSEPQQQQQAQQTVSSPQQTQQVQTNDRVFASPLARATAANQGVNIQNIGQGSGPGGRIIQQDVINAPQQVQQQAAPTQQAAPAAEAKQEQQFVFSSAPGENPYYDIPNNNMRKVIAKRLVESKQTVPHFYLSVDVEVDKVVELRKQLNSNPETKISVNDFIVKACSLALRDFPQANARWYDDKIRYFQNADISVAVSTDGGLITPIVYEANKKGLKEISANVKELASKARNGTLQPQEFQGGTFTISNLGMFGIDHFIAIANPPQACILAVSQSNKKVVYDESKADTDAPYSVKSIMNVTLSCDHRAVDGAVGAQFLQKFKFYIENPQNMLL